MYIICIYLLFPKVISNSAIRFLLKKKKDERKNDQLWPALRFWPTLYPWSTWCDLWHHEQITDVFNKCNLIFLMGHCSQWHCTARSANNIIMSRFLLVVAVNEKTKNYERDEKESYANEDYTLVNSCFPCYYG